MLNQIFKRMKTKSLIIPALFFFIFLVSCDKKTENTISVATAEDDALTTLLFDDVFSEVDDAMASMEDMIYGGAKKSADINLCKTITVETPDDSTRWPKTISIDYGEGCTSPNGTERSGKIITVVNGRYTDEGFSRTTIFENYFVDGYLIEGERKLVNEGINEIGNMIFSVTLKEGKVTGPEGEVRTKAFERVREWVAGLDTPRFRFDDEYMITGSASGINSNGENYTRTIIEPLHVANNCRWILSGVVELVLGDQSVLLDYGDDSCDRLATVTVDGETRSINLHR
jgi:hypothetical protein